LPGTLAQFGLRHAMDEPAQGNRLTSIWRR